MTVFTPLYQVSSRRWLYTVRYQEFVSLTSSFVGEKMQGQVAAREGSGRKRRKKATERPLVAGVRPTKPSSWD